MKNDLETCAEEYSALLDQACMNVGADLFEDQIEIFDLAMAKARFSAAMSLANHAVTDHQDLATYFLASTLREVDRLLLADPTVYGLSQPEISGKEAINEPLKPENVTKIGKQYASAPLPNINLGSEHEIIKKTFSDFSDKHIKPVAQKIHNENLLVPKSLIEPLKDLGTFGLSIPEKFGGLKPDDREDLITMVIVTEELSAGSLGAAGSLITRPEIIARALLEGGTEQQKNKWLGKIASGDTLCAVSVTEANAGSDVASVSLSASKTEGGYILNGSKLWCTFAGAANVILVLARTDKTEKSHKGLSLFMVEKPSCESDEFEFSQDSGGRMTGKAIKTLGYRGMHSFEMSYTDFFVPEENLIGGDTGLNRGFYYTMKGFLNGRLQTAARACGLMRSAYESTRAFATDRSIFNKKLVDHPLTLRKIADMAGLISASRTYTLDVAKKMEQGGGALDANLVKLFACQSAEKVARDALQLHGGMGYAQETEVSRHFVDAKVLSIFEGTEETLAVRVVGREMMAN